MDWREAYERKFLTPEEAAGLVKSGDTVLFTAGREGRAVGYALAGRLGEVQNVRVMLPTPGYDFPWYDEGWQGSFAVTVGLPTDACQDALDGRRADFYFGDLIPFRTLGDWDEPDMVITEVSPPNEKGFCSFGAALWNKKRTLRSGRVKIAEVNPNLIRTYGENYIHVSEIDYFVEHVSAGREPGQGSLAGRAQREPGPHHQDIARHVNSLLRSGDTLQIGVGRTTEPLVRLGALNGKEDLGYHSEATPAGIITLVKEGVINGKHKTINRELAVVTTIGGGTREEMAYVHENPQFRLMEVEYLEDVRVISAHDNFAGINNALAVDLTGQIAAESVGYRLHGVAGGQVPFAIGSLLSKGGRFISVLPSTARAGDVSRITPCLPTGTVVTTPRNCADYVVTEYGIAALRGRTLRQRVEALINIAHPDHRAELWKEAKRLYWP